jgi:GNAT superfamily N-acetyltransferase
MIEYHPLTPERWPDLEALFGKNGAVAGCWCMWWRLSPTEFKQASKEEHRTLFKERVEERRPCGVLAYQDDQPVGWVSVSPRSEYLRFGHTRNWLVLDDEPVWCVVCFFIKVRYRRQGLASGLLQAAAAYARSQGATWLEANPRDTHGQDANPLSVFFGTLEMFERAGFHEIARPQPDYPIMRLKL